MIYYFYLSFRKKKVAQITCRPNDPPLESFRQAIPTNQPFYKYEKNWYVAILQVHFLRENEGNCGLR